MKTPVGKVCMPALLQDLECLGFFYLFLLLLVSFSCWCCLITKFTQTRAPPSVQSRALVQIIEQSKKFFKGDFFFECMKQMEKYELLFLSNDFSFLCFIIRISGLLLLECILMVARFFVIVNCIKKVGRLLMF